MKKRPIVQMSDAELNLAAMDLSKVLAAMSPKAQAKLLKLSDREIGEWMYDKFIAGKGVTNG